MLIAVRRPRHTKRCCPRKGLQHRNSAAFSFDEPQGQMSGTRHQNGYVFRSGRCWYLRYYDTVLTDSGETHRVQNCKQLVVAEGAFRNKKSAQRLAEEYLKPFNDGTHRPEGTMSLKRFVENEYLPFIQRQNEARRGRIAW